MHAKLTRTYIYILHCFLWILSQTKPSKTPPPSTAYTDADDDSQRVWFILSWISDGKPNKRRLKINVFAEIPDILCIHFMKASPNNERYIHFNAQGICFYAFLSHTATLSTFDLNFMNIFIRFIQSELNRTQTNANMNVRQKSPPESCFTHIPHTANAPLYAYYSK